ncbi:protein tyrosine phosphatase family protein [Luteimonas sp. 50]|uniref:Protein tyrosine phosphatase family protein n=1 Tax=Cognatiluteimonas sedimenti TaxID=2927791 RepID=A0ABT0A3G0_9GAMM|nr:protein tyrosine phosphatase family protein [Lysobacter sedimenti]MCJ0825514.1 protein tyrosine phosphatase family protein [Lysobacter sedimenti]
MPRIAAIAFALLLAAGCASNPPEVTTPTVAVVEVLPGLYTAGQPAPGDWSAIAARGVATVVNLRTGEELAGRDEGSEVRAAGLRYVQIPVAGADGITVDNARLLHDALAPGHGQVLVHCASGNRAGALLALEQAEFDGVPVDAALALARKAGMTSTEPRLREALGLGR